MKVLHSQFVEIDTDITRFKVEFSEKECKVRELEEKVRLRESQLEEVGLRLGQKESSVSVLESQLERRERRVVELEESQRVMREERTDVEKRRKELSKARSQVKEIIRLDSQEKGRRNLRWKERKNLVDISIQTDQNENFELIAKVSVDINRDVKP